MFVMAFLIVELQSGRKNIDISLNCVYLTVIYRRPENLEV
jgi:hypothetical protein